MIKLTDVFNKLQEQVRTEDWTRTSDASSEAPARVKRASTSHLFYYNWGRDGADIGQQSGLSIYCDGIDARGSVTGNLAMKQEQPLTGSREYQWLIKGQKFPERRYYVTAQCDLDGFVRSDLRAEVLSTGEVVKAQALATGLIEIQESDAEWLQFGVETIATSHRTTSTVLNEREKRQAQLDSFVVLLATVAEGGKC